MKKSLLTLSILGGLLGVSSMMLHNPQPIQTMALNEKVSSFEVIAGNDYSTAGNVISTTTGSFVAQAEADKDYHFSGKITASAGQNDEYGVVLNGSYVDSKLSGDVIRMYLNGDTWFIKWGTLKDNVFSEITNLTADFGTSWSGQLDLYVYNGMMALRMDNWSIGGYDLVNTEGDVFLYSNGVNFGVENPTISANTSGIANYLYRNGWGGFNHHGYTYCFGPDTVQEFTMNLPAGLDRSKVTKLMLVRGTLQRTGGQEADVTANGTVVPGGFPNCTLANMERYTELAMEVPLSVIASTGTINFEITVKGSEMVGHNYKLIYETEEGRFAADHLIFHSAVSEAAHNYSHSSLGWNDNQYLFCDINQTLANDATVYCGTHPGAKVLKMGNYDLFTGSSLAYTFTTNAKHSINFLDLIDMHEQDAWHYRNELWLDFGSGSSYCGTGVYEFNPAAASGTYWLDFFLDGMDNSIGMDRKFTPTNSFAITLDNLAIVEDYAQRFLTATQSFGSKTASEKSTVWNAFSEEYTGLNADQKEIFKTNTTNNTIKEAQLRYQCIASRNYDGLNDFVFGTVPQPRNVLTQAQQTNAIIVVVCLSAFIGVALLTVSIHRKKKAL